MKYSELAKKLETATSETRNLIVRPFRNSDEDGLLELFRDQNTMRMDGDTPILEKNLPCQKLADKLGFIKTDIIKGKHKDPLTGVISDDFQYSLKNSHTS